MKTITEPDIVHVILQKACSKSIANNKPQCTIPHMVQKIAIVCKAWHKICTQKMMFAFHIASLEDAAEYAEMPEYMFRRMTAFSANLYQLRHHCQCFYTPLFSECRLDRIQQMQLHGLAMTAEMMQNILLKKTIPSLPSTFQHVQLSNWQLPRNLAPKVENLQLIRNVVHSFHQIVEAFAQITHTIVIKNMYTTLAYSALHAPHQQMPKVYGDNLFNALGQHTSSLKKIAIFAPTQNAPNLLQTDLMCLHSLHTIVLHGFNFENLHLVPIHLHQASPFLKQLEISLTHPGEFTSVHHFFLNISILATRLTHLSLQNITNDTRASTKAPNTLWPNLHALSLDGTMLTPFTINKLKEKASTMTKLHTLSLENCITQECRICRK